MFALCFLVGLIGLAVLAAGLSGRRVDQNLYCVGCRFDLTGTMRAAVAAGPITTAVCPECGASLGTPGAFRRGRREPRAGLVWSGLVVLVFSVLWGSSLIWMSAAGVGIERFEPFWMVKKAASARMGQSSLAAQKELVRRIRDGALTRPQINELVIEGIKRQNQGDRLWGAWGAIVGAADAAGCVTQAQRTRFIDQQLQWSARITRREVRVGDPLPIEVECSLRAVDIPGADVSRSTNMTPIHVSIISLALGEHAVPEVGPMVYELGGMTPDSTWFEPSRRNWAPLANVSTGKYSAQGRLSVATISRVPGMPDRQIGEAWEIQFSTPIHVLPTSP